jgi:hypothetical protein
MEMPMKLIDDLKMFFSSNNREIEGLKAIIEVQKNRLTELSVENDNLNQDFIDLMEHHETDMADYGKMEDENIYLRETLRLIETTHKIGPDNNWCDLAERLRIMLFDVVRMYSELEKEIADDRKRTD